MTFFWVVFLSGMAGIIMGYLAGHHEGVKRGATGMIGSLALAAAKSSMIAEFKALLLAANELSKAEVKAAFDIAKEIYDSDSAD